MWVFTRYGFFSVVVDKRNKKKLVIRSRDHRHLENLQLRFTGLLQSIAIERHAGTDYPFRMAVSRVEWAKMASHMAQEIDYTNFKDMAETRTPMLGKPYVKSLHDIWQVLWSAYRPTLVAMAQWKKGDRVYWTDPDAGLASGPGTVEWIQSEGDDAVIKVALDDGGEAEVLSHELKRWAHPRKKKRRA